jgi:type IV pilus assembly protein PilW
VAPKIKLDIMKDFRHLHKYRSCGGFTLIEMLVSSSLSLVVLGAALYLYSSSQHSYRTQSLNRQIQENGRFALQIIGEDLRMARYLGINMMLTTIDDPDDTASLVFGCGGAGWASDIMQPIYAENNSNPYAANCIEPQNYTANTDVLVVRHVESQPVATSNIQADHLYLHTSLLSGKLFKAGENGVVDVSVDESPVHTYKLSTNVYYIRPCSDAGDNSRCGDAEDDTIPTLVRETLTGTGTRTEPLVEFVENFQIRFGIDTGTDYIVDQYVDPNEVGDWSKALSARIFVLVRSPSAVTGYNNNNTYVAGDTNVVPADNYYRKLFSETLQLRNPSLDINI